MMMRGSLYIDFQPNIHINTKIIIYELKIINISSLKAIWTLFEFMSQYRESTIAIGKK